MRRMLKAASVLVAVPILAACTSTPAGSDRVIRVCWQRLVTETGTTCERCGMTQTEVRNAVNTLRRCLRPLHFEVALEETSMAPAAVARDTLQSNRVFVDDRPLEDWVGGRTGMSLCGSCCDYLGPGVQCRTVAVEGQTYEAVPADLIVRAGLLAAEAALARRAARER
ncbi:MAG: DUF2703 domain-containing protein [Planctomycetota bacterium]